MTGLRLLLLACVAGPAAAALAIVLLCVLILVQDDPRLAAQGALCLLGGGLLLSLIGAAVGLAYCCRAPSESGARRPLLWAVVLAVVGLVVWAIADPVLSSLVSQPLWPRGWLIRLIRGVSAGSLAAACLCWLLFLRAIVDALGNEPLGRGLRRYAIGFAAWAGIALASLWLLEIQERDNLILVAIASVNLMLGFGHTVWMLGLLAAVSEAIEAALPKQDHGQEGIVPQRD